MITLTSTAKKEIFEYAKSRIKKGCNATESNYFTLYKDLNDIDRYLLSIVERVICNSESEKLTKKEILENVKWELGN